MRRVLFFIAIFLFTLSSVMGQMIPINLPADGNWPTIVGDSIMIIGPRQNELTEEQRYFNPIYLMTYPGKEHLKAQMIRAGACDCDPTIPNRRIGVFSVAPDKKVSFSQGNLQYLPAIHLWKFADTQYEYLGNANKYLKPTFRNWVDLFGWSANNTTAPFGVSTSTNAADYAGDFVDWGTNTICGDAPGTWRTLSVDEWGYLFQGRKNATQLYSKGNIDGLRGMIILPDNWVMPEGLHFTAQPTNLTMELDINTYTQAEWQRMEEAGAVFLCPTGRRDGTKIDYLEYYGGYWSSSKISNSNHVCHMYYNYKSKIFMTDYKEGDYSYGTNGRAVRLVHDTIVLAVEPEYVDLGLSVKWATFNVGANSPEDYGDYFAWGETEPKETYSWATYKWCDGTQNTMTKYNATDGKTILEPADDAAQIHWGDKWRMPSKEEVDELTQQCNWIWTTHNNVNGYKVTGPNGNSIFLPAAGYKGAGPTYPAGEDGLYWTSTLEKGHYSYLIVLHNDAPPTEASTKGTRCFGFTIRPVYDDRPPKRIGVFSVAADKQVSFSQGNLQYIQSTDTWQFAANQWDFIGEKNIYSGVIADKIDFFGWSTNNPQSLWGLIFTQSNVYYSGTFVDWGNNLIMGDLANTWRTLSLNEWTYLLRQRENANNLYTYANINGTNGLVLLPDKWEAIDEIPISIATDYSANTFSFSQWETLEAKGAVFLPSCGVYMGNNYNHETAGLYWTNTPDESDETKSHCLYVTKRYIDINYSGNRSTNRSVRLVHDTIVPKVEPEYVDLGLSVKWATFNVGATSPNEIGNFYAWGEIEPKDTYTVNNYKWWNKTSKEITKYCTIDSLAYGGVADGLTELQPQDDIAHILKGEHWRMPDLDECKELGNGCTWTVSTRQGQIGFEGISKINGNTIFLPVVGFRAGVNLVHETLGGYWSSTLNIEKQSCAMGLYLNRETPSVGIYYNSSRQNGFLIRPVYDEVPDPCLVVKVNDTLSINMMCVEGGTFMMGRNDAGAPANEKPAHQVTLSDYLISQTEVTQGLWQAVMGTTDYKDILNNNNADTYQIGAEYPAYGIKLSEAQAFINRLNQLTNLNFRLPTEAEWEYAARGGQNSKGYIYSGSNNLDEIAWYTLNSNNEMHRVAQLKPNELGIYDMSGNGWEICADGYANYSAEAQINPLVERTGNMVIRGGSSYNAWSTDVYQVTYRMGRAPEQPHNRNVIRLVLHDIVPVQPEPEYVDLGLSVKWATFNVGATSPEDYGDYFAWGETEPKEVYSWATYKWGTSSNMTKYNTTDGKTILDLDDDAAYVNWGDKWRMPTKEECQELLDKCTWKEETRNGINGHIVTGPNGNSIFIPTTGYHNDDNGTGVQGLGTITYLWTSSTPGNANAYDLLLSHPTLADGIGSNTRRVGMPIRPVYDDRPDPCLVVKVNDTLSINMMCVEGGTFMMGSDSPGAEADEQPVHEVTLSDYYIGQIEVTQHLWKAVMGSSNNPSATKGDELPVTNITWNEAQTFVERLSELTGMRFRLPTEAEWEYAARGGQRSKGYTYAGSNDIDQVGWYNGNSSNKTHAVGQKQPNELGIYDMTGNVWEYCYDWHTPYAAQAQTNPTGAATGDKHVLRGGCYHYDPKNCTNTNRHSYYTPDKGGASTGLRIVLEP